MDLPVHPQRPVLVHPCYLFNRSLIWNAVLGKLLQNRIQPQPTPPLAHLETVLVLPVPFAWVELQQFPEPATSHGVMDTRYPFPHARQELQNPNPRKPTWPKSSGQCERPFLLVILMKINLHRSEKIKVTKDS